MFARLRENLLYKLMALAFAIALHFYVVGQENPPLSRTLLVPLTARSIPANLIFDEKTAPQVSVTLTGPADIVSHLPEADVIAMIDLSRAHQGKNTALPVRVPPLAENMVTVTDYEPHVLSLTLPARATRRMLITASDSGTPPAGFMFKSPQVTPRYATLVGSQDAVNSVQQVVANIDGGKTVGTIDNDFPVVPLDGQGAQVNEVAVTPAVAHVHIAMARVPASKMLLISPRLTGTPPYPYQVTGIDVSPQNVTVTGRPELLAQAYNIQTTPIDISSANADVTRRVTCVLPMGVMLSGSGEVTVTVHIAAQPTPTAPVPPVITPNEPKI